MDSVSGRHGPVDKSGLFEYRGNMENDPRTMRRQDLEAEILRLRESLRVNVELQHKMKAEIERLMHQAQDSASANDGEGVQASPELAAA